MDIDLQILSIIDEVVRYLVTIKYNDVLSEFSYKYC